MCNVYNFNYNRVQHVDVYYVKFGLTVFLVQC